MEEPDEEQLKKTLDGIAKRVDGVVQRLKEKGYMDSGKEKDPGRGESGPGAV